MQIETLYFDDKQWCFENEVIEDKSKVSILFVFGTRSVFKNSRHYRHLRGIYPSAYIVGSTSAGNVLGPQISKYDVVATAVMMEKGRIEINSVQLEKDRLKEQARELIEPLMQPDLKHLFIISEGININGSLLGRGLTERADDIVTVTGGLAGDDDQFKKTLIMANAEPRPDLIVAVGFYGDAVKSEVGCFAGWEEFGPDRVITRSKDNIVYTIDDQPALALYKKYLGDRYINKLPGSGLHFPLSIRETPESKQTIRTLLGINEEEQSLTFAGQMPEGYWAKLMRTDIDGLIDGAEKAALAIHRQNDDNALGLVVSCVGRRLVMKQLTDEELEVIQDIVGENVTLTGFYSYGELAPFSNEVLSCHLHNQTMTLTVIYENV